MKYKIKPPINEWLICWDLDPFQINFLPKHGGLCPFYFAYVTKEGIWMRQLDESCNIECSPPNYWDPI